MQFRYVFFLVDALDADPGIMVIQADVEVAVQGQREIILGDLISLHQVWIGIVLAVELGVFGDVAIQSQTGHDGVFYGLAVYHRQGARQPQTHGAYALICGGVLVIGATRAKHLAFGLELNMYLQTDDCFVFHIWALVNEIEC